jgi:ribulose-phosphate 3-epimerase
MSEPLAFWSIDTNKLNTTNRLITSEFFVEAECLYLLRATIKYGQSLFGRGDMELEMIPAILVKKRPELLRRISLVKDLVKTIHIDVMDGKFVPNKTIGLEELSDLPEAKYEFHWMVFNPEKWIEKIPGPHMHLVHLETLTSFEAVEAVVKKVGGRLGIVLNPETPIDDALPFLAKAEQVLVMTVHPGFSGQAYIPDMETKISDLRERFPNLNIEVDGGIDPLTIGRAHEAGANLLAAASSIFKGDVKENLKALRKAAKVYPI